MPTPSEILNTSLRLKTGSLHELVLKVKKETWQLSLLILPRSAEKNVFPVFH